MNISANMSDIDLAIQDAFVCGAGVVKIWFDGSQLTLDHVPIKDFREFGEELIWRASQTIDEAKQ